jgi:hypothetical protein
MNRFKIVDKWIVGYGGNWLPTQLDREFRTWDDHSVIFGVGLSISPGSITDLSISGRTLNESTGKLQGPTEKMGSDNPSEVIIESPDLTDNSSVLTGLGFQGSGKVKVSKLKSKPCHINGLKIVTVDISQGFLAKPPAPGPQGPQGGSNITASPLTREYMIGDGVELQEVLNLGYLANRVTARANPGNVPNAWAEWGKIIHGTEVSTEGFLASVDVRVDSQRVELSLESGNPINWYFNLDESLSTQMLLLSHAREAIAHRIHIRLAGVHWANESPTEVEAITLLSG